MTTRAIRLMQRQWRKLRRGRTAVIGIPYTWLLIFFLLPFLIVLAMSFRVVMPDGITLSNLFNLSDGETANFTLKLSNYWRLFTERYYWETYVYSVIYAAVTTAICLFIGYPFAYFMARAPKIIQPLLLMAVMVPFWTSFLLRVYAWKGLLDANSGWVGMLIHSLGLDSLLVHMGLISNPGQYLYTSLSLLLGMTYTYLPFMILPLYGTLSKMDHRLLEAAQDLGATPWQTFWKITVPLSVTGVVAGSMLVFIPCIGEYVIPKLLGDPSILTVGQTLYDEFSSNNDWPMASSLAVVMIMIIIVPMALFNNAMAKEEKR